MNQVTQIKRWFEQAVPSPTSKNVHTQLGVHFEEVAEMLSALKDAGSTFPIREQLSFAHDVVSFAQRQLKAQSKGVEIELKDLNRVELLDSLCDQIVTAIGVAHMLQLDIESALQEVADSNDSKFGPDGKPIFNEQLKIVKGPNYFAPDLSRYIGEKEQ